MRYKDSLNVLKKIRERERQIDKEEMQLEEKMLSTLSQSLREEYIKLKYKGEIVFNSKPNGKLK